MTTQHKPRKHQCLSCGRSFSSRERLGHHHAAEHAPKTSADIRRMPQSSLSLYRSSAGSWDTREEVMKSSGEPKGLRDIKTAVSAHIRSTSSHEGTPYLEVLALGMEKLRLTKESAKLSIRQERVQGRLEEIRGVIDARLDQVRGKGSPVAPLADGDLTRPGSARPNRADRTAQRTMPVAY